MGSDISNEMPTLLRPDEFLETLSDAGSDSPKAGVVFVLVETNSGEVPEGSMARLERAAADLAQPAVLVLSGNGVVPAGVVGAFDICLASSDARISDGGKTISADEAEHEGLIYRVVSDDVGSAAVELAEAFKGLAPIALAACKRAVREGLRTDLESGLALEIELFGKVFSTRDMREGTSAFLEKRKPRFTGE